SIVILDVGGRALARSSGVAEPEAEHPGIALAVARTRVSRMDLTEERPGRRLLTIGAPVFAEPGGASAAVLGVVVLRMNPETGLFRLFTGETSPRSDETLLFRRDSRKPGYLSPFRYGAAGWAAHNRSLEALQELANRSTDGRSVFGELTGGAGTRELQPEGLCGEDRCQCALRTPPLVGRPRHPLGQPVLPRVLPPSRGGRPGSPAPGRDPRRGADPARPGGAAERRRP